MQILEGIYMEATEDQLILRATDTEISMESRHACFVEEPGSIVLNASLFGDIVRKLPNAMVHIKSEGQKLSLVCEQSQFEIMGQNPEEYPQLPELGGDEKIVVTGEALLKAFKETQFATSNDDMRIVLTGVLLDVQPEGNHLRGPGRLPHGLEPHSWRTVRASGFNSAGERCVGNRKAHRRNQDPYAGNRKQPRLDSIRRDEIFHQALKRRIFPLQQPDPHGARRESDL